MNQKAFRSLKIIGSYIGLIIGIYLITNSWAQAIGGAAIGLVVFSYIVNSLREVLKTKVIYQAYTSHMEDLASQMVANVECAFCSKPNSVHFKMSQRNEFRCQHCDLLNLLLVNTSTAQITTPVANTVLKDIKE